MTKDLELVMDQKTMFIGLLLFYMEDLQSIN